MSEPASYSIESVVEDGSCYLRVDHLTRLIYDKALFFKDRAAEIAVLYDDIEDMPPDSLTALIALTCLSEEFTNLADTLTLDVMKYMDGLDDKPTA